MPRSIMRMQVQGHGSICVRWMKKPIHRFLQKGQDCLRREKTEAGDGAFRPLQEGEDEYRLGSFPSQQSGDSNLISLHQYQRPQQASGAQCRQRRVPSYRGVVHRIDTLELKYVKSRQISHWRVEEALKLYLSLRFKIGMTLGPRIAQSRRCRAVGRCHCQL